ncbi:MAG: tetratricopeptide repeat protein, partial [Pseudomonadota bacterium]
MKLVAAALALALTAAPAAYAAQSDGLTDAGEPIVTSDSLAGNYLAARIAANDKDTSAASAYYKRVLDLDPDNEEVQLKAFLTYVANGEFDAAIELGTPLGKLPNTPEMVAIVMAVDDLRSRNWKGVEKRLDRDWQSSLDRLVAGLVRAWGLSGAGKADDALAIIDDLDGPAWFDLFTQYHGGLIALAANRPDDAADRLKVAVENRAGAQGSGETYMRAVEAYVSALVAEGDAATADETVREFRELQPQNPALAALEPLLAEGGKPAIIRKAKRGAAEVLMNIGTALNREGGENFARIYMQLANVLASEDILVRASLADLLDRQGLLTKANALFDTIPEESAYGRIARLEQALNLDEMGDFDAARKELEALSADRPDDLVVSLSYGAVLARHEKFADAAKVYQAAVDRLDVPQPRHWNLYYRLGIAYERTGNWPFAEAAFRNALVLNPDQPSVLNYLGYSLVEMDEKVPEALDMIRKAVDQRPNDGYIVDSLGWAYYKLKRFP